jgi:LysR family glycine cleavage system transcriptional activator
MPKDNRHLPPLNALRAFEATARHLSVKDAAEELCVTPGAVSQLLKALELHYGVRLFNRGNRSITLTDVGQTLLPAIRGAFKMIADVSEKVMSLSDSGVLTVSATPFFASAWLIPRMHLFSQIFPKMDLRVVTQGAPSDFTRAGVDVAIRHGLGGYPGLRSEHVAAVDVVPVAAHELIERLGRPAKPGDLLRWPLIHDAERKGWYRWFQSQGIIEAGVLRGPSFDDPNLLMRSVLAGKGAALLPVGMFSLEEAEGRIVRLADQTLLEDFAYYLVYPERALRRGAVAAFRQWILDDKTKKFIEASNRAPVARSAVAAKERPPKKLSRSRRRPLPRDQRVHRARKSAP